MTIRVFQEKAVQLTGKEWAAAIERMSEGMDVLSETGVRVLDGGDIAHGADRSVLHCACGEVMVGLAVMMSRMGIDMGDVAGPALDGIIFSGRG